MQRNEADPPRVDLDSIVRRPESPCRQDGFGACDGGGWDGTVFSLGWLVVVPPPPAGPVGCVPGRTKAKMTTRATTIRTIARPSIGTLSVRRWRSTMTSLLSRMYGPPDMRYLQMGAVDRTDPGRGCLHR